jgi:glycosyltransferase involved in cell wall biosynthesis
MKSSSDLSIGVLTWDYRDPKGGLGRSFDWIVSALRDAGRIVEVGSPTSDKARNKLLTFTHRTGGHMAFSFLLSFVAGGWLKRRNIKTLIVPAGPGGVFLLTKPKMHTIVVSYHTYEQQSRLVPGQHWKRIFIPFERRTLRSATRVLCFCEDTKKVLTEYYNIPANKILLLPHSIDTTAWKPSRYKKSGTCICVARLEPRKGVDILLKAWPEVIKKAPHAQLTIVGKGSDAQSVDAVIKTLKGTAERVADISPEELRKRVAQSDVSVCPSHLEGFGLAAAESMAAGTAVVAFDAEGLRSMITHEETGLLAKAGDTQELADAIVRMLTDSQSRLLIAEAARAYSEITCDPVHSAEMLIAAVASCERDAEAAIA